MALQSDAVIVGANTIIRDDPLLTVRYVRGKNPIRVVIDGNLRVPLSARIFNDDSAKTVVYTSSKASKNKVASLRKLGVDVYILKDLSNGLLKVSDVLKHLHEYFNVKRVLVEGGATLLWSFFSEGVVDEFRLTISPYIIGGLGAVTIVSGRGFGDKSEWVKLKLKDVRTCECGNEVHIVYEVLKL